MNPPPSWSKPASALGLSSNLNHLPQSQQVRQLQEQIQQHRRLQRQQSQGYGYGLRKKSSQANGDSNMDNNGSFARGNTASTNQDRPSMFQQPSFGGGHQHINIKNTDDMISDEDIDEDEMDEEDDKKSEDRNQAQDSGGMMGLHHHRSLSNSQVTQGFVIPSGFTGFAPSSPLSPSSPGSITSDTSPMTSSMLSPGLLASSTAGYSHHQHSHGRTGGNGGNNNNNNNNNTSIHGIETSLASLASLSVMPSSSPSPSGSSSSAAMPMAMPGATRGRPAFSSHYSGPSATTPTTPSFQPQSLPMMYQHHSSGFIPTSTAQTPSFNAISSAITQHFQRQQQQQQQQLTSAAMSSSLPANSSYNQFQPQSSPSQQSQPQEAQPQNSPRTRSKSLTIPAPRIIPPARALPPRAPQTSAPRKYHGRQTRKVPSVVPTPKEPVDPTRRVAHIISEQKRREKINGGFDELKSVIPECAQNTDSKATILRKAVDYIVALEEELRKYVDLYQMEAGSNPESSLEDHERER
ncbi:hypothetical protein BX616_004978 [Lobosporangium transversale]|nr:hypothetical protein BX616_004978 [Lobosporangium transversale]